jgi:hypothetical protein
MAEVVLLKIVDEKPLGESVEGLTVTGQPLRALVELSFILTKLSISQLRYLLPDTSVQTLPKTTTIGVEKLILLLLAILVIMVLIINMKNPNPINIVLFNIKYFIKTIITNNISININLINIYIEKVIIVIL